MYALFLLFLCKEIQQINIKKIFVIVKFLINLDPCDFLQFLRFSSLLFLAEKSSFFTLSESCSLQPSIIDFISCKVERFA